MVSNINNMCRLHNRDKGKMTTLMGSCLDRRWWMTLRLLVHSVLNDHSPRKFLVHCAQELFWFIAFLERLLVHYIPIYCSLCKEQPLRTT
jgi:hypothetical protein